ncbi:hypothetical protein BABINDRAFT_158894 [Babjeviella inositovora NRRL Y-12698]|uniref:Autophagy-related protein 33 n=1 Tax=Babjeviella inositovora NRRL Y-12698 TaxID=984486 RepID=A0A1E3QX83_9ASCO|nr:uncharacterized protein BABINDRAFT_158894 [Babjeviella inositovora NRRL Y-12698]ODQ82260.1 hypothetical protein BABINDRAFT_158894 [Babjeviella inositovora NRRL Y-12698]
MADTCIQNIKLIGAASLGLATGVLAFNANRSIPSILTTIANTSADKTAAESAYIKKSLDCLINTSRATLAVVGSAAGYALVTAFRYSPVSKRHPYLLYSAVGVPLSWIVYFFYDNRGFGAERNISAVLKDQEVKSKAFPPLTKTTPAEKIESEEVSPLDNSVYNDLGVESASLELESIASSTTASPATDVPVEDDDNNIEFEIDQSLLKNVVTLNLNKLQCGYNAVASVLGVSFALASVGVFGEYYF